MHNPNIEEVKLQAEKNLIDKANVVAVGIAQKNGDGPEAITVFVTHKKDPSELSAHDAVPTHINGIPTDVVEIGEIRAHGKFRPVYGGISGIHYTGTACTLGAIVYKNGKSYGLTNVHCCFPHWEGAKLGDPFIQPSPNDGGQQSDVIGRTKEAVPLKFDGSYNEFDAGLVELSVEATELYQDVIGKHSPTPMEVKIGDEVQKSGRTTGYRKSRVLATNVTSRVYYDEGANAIFKNQIFCDNEGESFSAGGDSGALVLNMNGNPVGLNYAGSNKVEIMNPIIPILNYYGVSFENKKPAPVDMEGFVALQKLGDRVINYVDFDPKTIKPGVKGDTNYSLSFRKKPSVTGEKMRVLPPNTQFEIIGDVIEDGGYLWSKVKVK